MNTFVLLFGIPVATIDEWVKNTDEAERAKQSDDMMAEWTKWFEDNAGAITDRGLPLGKTKRVTKGGVADTRNDLNYYVTVQAESHEAAAALAQACPHLQIPDAFIEVMAVTRPSM